MQTTTVLLQKNCRNVFAYGRGLFSLAQKNAQRAGDGRYWETADIGSHSRDFAQQPMERKTAEKTALLLQSAVASALLMALSVALAALFFSRDGVSCFSAAFSNAGFIGIPLVQSVLGGDAAFLISAMIVMIGLLQYTVGLFMITGDRGKMKAGAVLKHPEGCRGLLGAVICRKYSKTGACRFAVFHRWKHQHPACHAAVGSLSGKGQI